MFGTIGSQGNSSNEDQMKFGALRKSYDREDHNVNDD